MDNRETRAILGLLRPGKEEVADLRFGEAEARAQADPALASWWETELQLDQALARKFQATHVPAGLKARILTPQALPNERSTSSWRRRILLAAAALVALAVMFSSWRGPFQPAASLANYRDEMVSFITVAPTLEIESDDLSKIGNFLQEKGAPGASEIPSKLRALVPVGCRVLRFRGHDVTLICFQRGQGKLLHLFVVDRSALGKGTELTQPEFAAAGDWMTAAWTEDGQACLLMLQGDRAQLDEFLPAR